MTFRCMLAMVSIVAAVPLACGQADVAKSAPAASVSATQGQASAAPVFDVAAIHINHSDESARSHIISSPYDSHFRAINVPLKMFIQWAYVLPDSRILGGPSWLGSTKFDIEASSDPSVDDRMHSLNSAAGKLQKQKMLQALLANRFQLKVHEESRELPIYSLVLAKDGPKFQPSQINGTTIDGRNGEIKVKGSDDTVGLLADELARPLGRPVINDTGLHGRYELTLKWTPDDPASAGPGAHGPSDADPSLPSIFTALEEQLGLKLVARKGPVPVLVVDRAEMPSQN